MAVSRRGAIHDRAAARAISAAASDTPLPPPLPACASRIFATWFQKIITEATFKKLEKNFSGLCYRIIAFSLETCGHSIEYAAQRNSCITLSNAAPP